MEATPCTGSDHSDLVLVNPTAGGGLARTILPRLREFAKQYCWNVSFCVTESPNDLAEKARAAAQSGRKRIFVVGGDGTFHVLINAVADYPGAVLAVLPAGGGNDLAAALGLPGDPIEAAKRVLKGEVRLLDVAHVSTADGNERRYVGGGGVGLDTEAVRHANGRYRNLRGRTRYVLSALRALAGFRPIRMRITSRAKEFEPLEATVLLVAVLNTPSYGAGMYLAPNAGIEDGQLDLVLVEDLKAFEVLRILPGLLSRGELPSNHVRRFRIACARIETDTPCWFHGDGELIGKTPVEVSVIPGAVRVLRAARDAPQS